MTKQEFTELIEGLETQVLTEELKETIIEYFNNLDNDPICDCTEGCCDICYPGA